MPGLEQAAPVKPFFTASWAIFPLFLIAHLVKGHAPATNSATVFMAAVTVRHE
jgi:hypothetical protein